jgi:mannosyltransferase
MEPRTRRDPLWTLAPLLPAVVAAVLGAITLGRKPLWFDERVDAELVQRSWPDLLRSIGDAEPSQAVYLVLLKTWADVVGAGDAVLLRLPSVALAAAAAALLVVLGRELFDRWTGLAAGILLATNAYVVTWSQQARAYTLAVLAVVTTTLLFVRARRSTGAWWWLAYGVAGAASIWCHFYAGIVLLAHLVALAADTDRPPWRRAATAWGAVAVGLSPIVLYIAYGTRENVEWISPPSPGLVWESLTSPAGKSIGMLLAAALGLVAIVARRSVSPAPWKAALLAVWVALPLTVGVLASLIRPFLVPRYAIVIAPALALLAAVAVTSLAGRRAQAAALLALIALTAVHTWAWYGRESTRVAGPPCSRISPTCASVQRGALSPGAERALSARLGTLAP